MSYLSKTTPCDTKSRKPTPKCGKCVDKFCCWFWLALIWLISLNLVILSIMIIYSLSVTLNDFNIESESILLDQNQTITIGHRGYVDKYQPNTKEAIIDAYNHNVAAEFDVVDTMDGKYVITHDSNVRNLKFDDISNISQFFKGWTFGQQLKVPLLNDVLDAICTNDNFLSNTPYILIDLKVYPIPYLLTETNKKHNHNLLKIIEQSTCGNLSDITIFFESFNGPSLQHLMQNVNNYQITSNIETVLWIADEIWPGMVFWLKTRLWAMGIAKGYGPSCIDVPRESAESYQKNIDILNKYRNLGFCIMNYQPGDSMDNFVDYDELNIDSPHVEQINVNATIWNVMVNYMINNDMKGKTYNHTISIINYVFMVIDMVIGWVFVIVIIILLSLKYYHHTKKNQNHNLQNQVYADSQII